MLLYGAEMLKFLWCTQHKIFSLSRKKKISKIIIKRNFTRARAISGAILLVSGATLVRGLYCLSSEEVVLEWEATSLNSGGVRLLLVFD